MKTINKQNVQDGKKRNSSVTTELQALKRTTKRLWEMGYISDEDSIKMGEIQDKAINKYITDKLK